MKLGEITPYYKEKARRRLRTYFDLATPQHIENGVKWYESANEHVQNMHRELSMYTTEQIAGVISALSPRNKWERNLFDAKQVLDAVNDNADPSSIKVCTFNTNKLKAFAIAKGKVKIESKSRKTFSFIRNISRLDAQHVTIDVWHLRAMFGKTVESGLTPKRYDELAKLTIQEADKVGLLGYQYQAIIWECIRDRDELI
jgi:hypothetical protein